MSVTVKKDPHDPYQGRFLLKLEGDRRRHVAADLDEVAIGIFHYFNANHDKTECPLCKEKR